MLSVWILYAAMTLIPIELDNGDMSVSPLPSPLPHVGEVDEGDCSDVHESLPSSRSKAAVADLENIMPPPPGLPPYPDPPPKGLIEVLPPPQTPPSQQSPIIKSAPLSFVKRSLLQNTSQLKSVKDFEIQELYKVDKLLDSRDALVVEREETLLGTQLSPTSFLKKILNRVRDDAKSKSESLFKSVSDVYMNFIEARKKPDSDYMNVEDSDALDCYIQGNLKLGPNNQHIYQFLSEILPNISERQKRRDLIQRLTKDIRQMWPQAKIVPYGSFGSGLSLKSSDIDLTVFRNGLFKDGDVWNMVVDEEYATAQAGKSSTRGLLCPIFDLMHKKGMLRLELIDAKVPIVRFVDPEEKIKVDISLYGIDGFLNTKLLSSFQNMDQRIPNLIALVKNWARVSNLNKTVEGGLSSYSYNLMVVNFCQMRGVALVLHHATNKTFKVRMEENIYGFCEYKRGDKENNVNANANDGMTLYELLKSFFLYWEREYNYYDDVVSVRTGKTISRREAQCCSRYLDTRIEKIIIEDPFQIHKNVCGSLKLGQLLKLKKEFATSSRILETGARNWIDRYRPELIVASKDLLIDICGCFGLHNFAICLASEDTDKSNAALFSPFWNEIIKSLREEDYISNREMDLLSMPCNAGSLRLVQWPLFLLSSKILLAIDLALDCKDTQADLWNRICRDEYMAYAVQECYYSIEKILYSLVDGEGRVWAERIFREINTSIAGNSLVITLLFKKLPVVLSRFTALTGLLIRNETPELAKGAAKAVHDVYELVTHELLSLDLREQIDTWNIMQKARSEGRLFSRIEWPKDPEIKELVKRLHLLLTVKDSAANIPKNLEARRRLEFFPNSLFMDMPSAKPVSEMMPFCVFTPYYSETVLYSSSELRTENEDGISILFYLQNFFPVTVMLLGPFVTFSS
ncbi:hypothetical protein AgCh_011345 [Apium graveolens]